MSEVVQPELIENNSFIHGVIVYGAMLIVAFLFGSVPVFISYRKSMNR